MKHLALAGLLAGLLGAAPLTGQTMTVQEIARLSTDSSFTLAGPGLVMGLPGTGDSGKELAMAEPLARVLQHNGIPLPDLRALEKTRSVALVMVACEVPAGGARLNDRLDITVATMGTASSLEGGQLFVAPLLGAIPGSPVYAMASGPVMLQDRAIPTTARVAGGAQIVRELVMPAPETRFVLVLEPHYRGYAAASQVATAINDTYFNSPSSADGPRVAYAIDDRTVTVEIPEGERAEPAAFIADVMATQIAESLLKLPAVVICNVRTGAITFKGEVRISPVAVTMDGISVTSTIPAPVPTPADPLVTQSRWIGLTTEPGESQGAKLDELLAAFKQLSIPPKDQIAIIQQIHKQGCLHAKLIVE